MVRCGILKFSHSVQGVKVKDSEVRQPASNVSCQPATLQVRFYVGSSLVKPSSARAIDGDGVRGHEPLNCIDGNLDTKWVDSGVLSDRRVSTLEIEFRSPQEQTCLTSVV